MKHFRSNIFTRILVAVFMLPVALSGQSRNENFQGNEIIMDRPDGDFKHFKAEYSYYWVDWVGRIIEGKLEVSMVFTPEGTVYIKGFGWRSPMWIKAHLEGENIVISKDAIVDFYYYPAIHQGSSLEPLIYMTFARYDDTLGEIVEDETLTEVVFTPTASGGYQMRMPENTGWLRKKNSTKEMITKIDLELTDYTPIVPPEGYEEEDYQINFIPFAQTYLQGFEGDRDASLRLKVVRTEDSFYIKGLGFFDGPDVWFKGRIEGKRVVFPQWNEEVNSAYGLYMTAVTDGHSVDSPGNSHTHYQMEVTPLAEDIIFDYDPTTGNLTNPSSVFICDTPPFRTYRDDVSSEMVNSILSWSLDFYNEAEIIRIPEDVVYRPFSPSYLGPWYNNCRVKVNYRDANGYMMDPYKMYLRFHSKSGPIVWEYLNMDNWEYEMGDKIPFGRFYLDTVRDITHTGYNLSNNQRYIFYLPSFVEPSDISWVELIYEDGGESWSSTSVDRIIDDSASVDENAPIYDLTGRRVDPNNLEKGIYIRNGRKFIVP